MEAKVRSCMYFKLEIKFQRVFGDAGGRRGWDELREEHGHTHCRVWNSGRQEAGMTARGAQPREFSSGFHDDLESGMWGEFRKEEVRVHTELIHFIVQQKLTQHCKSITLQLKKVFWLKVLMRFSFVECFFCIY